jgi:hypothetical protein
MTNTNSAFLNGALCNDAPVSDESVSDSFGSNPSAGGNPPSISQGKPVSTGCQGGATSDESKNGHEPESAASGAESSTQQPEVSSEDTSLSKPEPASPPTALQKKSKNAIASANTFVVKVDASTGTIKVNGNLQIFGTNDRDSTLALTNQVAGVVQTNAGGLDSQNLGWALTTIYRIAPQDEIEGLLSAQMVCVHSLAMQCLKRASRGDRTTGGIDANINSATKLLRTFTTQMEALNRHRGKLGQPMVVGNVNVNEGGQAIVGPVSHDGRGRAPTENDPDKVE